MPEADALVRVAGVRVERGGRRILDDVDLEIGPARILTLIGPNGAGKTTLVRVILGLERPRAGAVHRRPGLRVGYMPQRLAVPEHMPLDVARFIRLGARADDRRLAAVGEETGVAHLLGQPMQTLSGGEHQRVLLCRALIRDPELLVLDEPAQGVDVGGQGALYRLLSDLRERRGCSVLIVSHDLHLVMAATDEVLCLNRHVCCAGHPEKVIRDDAYLKLFGLDDGQGMALYAHRHDHRHTMHGDVVLENGRS